MSKPDKFDQQWQNAFDGAEITPPPAVWTNVRAEVATGQAQKQKAVVVYWRWMAAASVTLLMLLGAGSWYYYDQLTTANHQLAEHESQLLNEIALLEEGKCIEEPDKEQANMALATDTNDETATEQSDEQLSEDEASLQGDRNLIADQANDDRSASNGNEEYKPQKNKQASQSNEYAPLIVDQNYQLASNDVEEKQSDIVEHQLVAPTSNESIALLRDQQSELNLLDRVESDFQFGEYIANIEMYKVPDPIEILKMQQGAKDKYRRMWAGLSMGGGSFNSNVNRGGDAFALASDALVNQQGLDGQVVALDARSANGSVQESPAFSFNIGADFGKQIGKRTFVQSGLEYAKYSTSATSNLTVNEAGDNQAFLRFNNSADLANNSLIVSDTYEVSNNFEYLAIPLKLGYQLIDRKIGFSINSGVSGNYFLRNTLTDESGNSNKVSSDGGAASAYKPLSFNGLLGVELSYQWKEYYHFSIVPDYRISLDGITKSDAFFISRPSAFFLGLRFKYILK